MFLTTVYATILKKSRCPTKKCFHFSGEMNSSRNQQSENDILMETYYENEISRLASEINSIQSTVDPSFRAEKDFVKIPDVIESPITISSGQYENRPAIVFGKTYSNERWVVFAVDSGKGRLDVYFNIGRGKYDGKFHFYDLTNKIRDTARRINGVERPRGFLSENGISDISIFKKNEIVNTSSEKSSSRNQQSYEKIKKQSAEN